jgi:hypothetical protein
VRALLVDKDGAPSWRPASAEDVDPADVEAYFAPFGDAKDEFVVPVKIAKDAAPDLGADLRAVEAKHMAREEPSGRDGGGGGGSGRGQRGQRGEKRPARGKGRGRRQDD